MKKKRIIIIGSNGFIAKSVIRFLDKKNFNLIKIDRKRVDLEKPKMIRKLKNLIKTNDIIFFAAAKAPVKDFIMFHENLNMCFNFIEIIKKKRIKRLVYLSSDAVYSDSKKKINERSETKPLSLHGMMHLVRENIFKSIFPRSTIILRPTLVYGKNDPHGGYGPNKFNKLIKLKKEIFLFGKGEERRDHVNIEDVGKIIANIIKLNLKGIFNIVSGKVISFHDIAKILVNLSNKKIKIKYIKRNGPMPHNGYRAFDNKKLKKFKLINESIQIQDLKTLF